MLKTGVMNSILFGIIMILLFLIFTNVLTRAKNNNAEHMCPCASVKETDKEGIVYKNEDINPGLSSKEKISPSCQMKRPIALKSAIEHINEVDIPVYLKKPNLQDKMSPTPDICNTNEYENINERLIRDVVIGKRFQQGEKQSNFDNSEILAYQSGYLDFDLNVNNSSRNREDPVEKIAEARTAFRNETLGQQGQTISDVYDGIINDQAYKMKNCKYPGCVIPGTFDELSQRQNYNDDNNFSNYHTKYETDNENNGGKWYGNVEGFDENMSIGMATN